MPCGAVRWLRTGVTTVGTKHGGGAFEVAQESAGVYRCHCGQVISSE